MSEEERRSMEPQTVAWILEFLLGQMAVPDRLVKRLLADAAVPVSGVGRRLKKAMVLRSIEAEVESGSVPEELLEWMEVVEELDLVEGGGGKATEAMKAAYCAIAVECVAKYLCFQGRRGGGKGGGGGGGKYLEAVERVWRGRVRALEEGKRSELVTEEVRKWRDVVEEAVWDSGAREKLVERNTRNEALKLVGEFLNEAIGLMGPSFLEISVRKFLKRRRKNENSGPESVAGDGNSKSPHMGPELAVPVRPPGKENNSKRVNHKQKYVASGKRHRGPVRIVDSQALDAEVPSSKDDAVPARGEVPVQQGASAGIASGKDDTLPARDEVPVQEAASAGVTSSKYDTLPSPEVTKVQEALKASLMELKAALKEPLPDPLRSAGTLFAKMANTILNQESLSQNMSGSAEKQKGEDVNAVDRSVYQNIEPAHSKERNRRTRSCSHENGGAEMASKDTCHVSAGKGAVSVNPSGKQTEPSQDKRDNSGNPSCSHPIANPHPSLMERNSTARTFEWDDSIDGSSEDTTNHKRIRLSTPRRHAVSPLKKYEMTKITRRRKIRRWSAEEEEALREGVKKFGKGNWKLILNFKREIFVERTEVKVP
ncbi:hypothetical protein Tsubulata_007347 [Turnera subulata]|uniref:HTH myb-type domain-containing protein n=1 Tax=Turnera subulata TaxID=218843 RepID=A0A9Q0JB77_9ROSI|nr:hypothetical protein Tsubulata_007347 [Turnera subulata]